MQVSQLDDCKPTITQVLERMARMQGLILKSHLAEMKVANIKDELADLNAQAQRINTLVANKTDELLRLTEDAYQVQCELRGDEHNEDRH